MNITHCAATQPGRNEKRALAVLQSLSEFVTELNCPHQPHFCDTTPGQIDGNSPPLKFSFPQVFSKVRTEKESDSEEFAVLKLRVWGNGVQVSPAKLRSC